MIEFKGHLNGLNEYHIGGNTPFIEMKRAVRETKIDSIFYDHNFTNPKLYIFKFKYIDIGEKGELKREFGKDGVGISYSGDELKNWKRTKMIDRMLNERV